MRAVSPPEAPRTRLNKRLSEAGVCSRREADRLIDAGRVTVNGAPASLGTQVGPTDRIELDGVPVADEVPPPPGDPTAAEHVYVAYHKPRGIICTTDPNAPDNIIQAVGHPRRIFPVGRLDVASEGLILLTSDGDVVNKILRAGNAHEKEYEVTVDRPIDAAFLRKMASGVPIMDTVTLPCRIRQDARDRFTLVLTQGLNRQIRRMCEALGYEAVKLRRVRVMNIRLGDLPLGRWRDLSPAERTEMARRLAHSRKTPSPPRDDAEID